MCQQHNSAQHFKVMLVSDMLLSATVHILHASAAVIDIRQLRRADICLPDVAVVDGFHADVAEETITSAQVYVEPANVQNRC